MRNDERLRTIYEVMAPYIVRNEHNWRDYLAFASQFHKHSFDNILLVYAQDEDVSILATRKQWATIGRNLIPRAKGVAVCVYRNAKLTLDYLFDVSQTMFFLTNMRPYESDLDTITPEIQTPRAVGQYQHGSARWMTDSEKDKAFDSYILDPHNPTIRQLLDTGYDGLDFLKEK